MTSKKSSALNGLDQSKGVALCASCDRCRSRKTKCDGKRPCGNCALKYTKKHRLLTIDGVDVNVFECVYSPAKRRGPVPGKAGQVRKADAMEQNGLKRNGNLLEMGLMSIEGSNMTIGQQAQLASLAAASEVASSSVDQGGNDDRSAGSTRFSRCSFRGCFKQCRPR